MNLLAQSDYDCIGHDEFYIVKTCSDMKSSSKIKASELKSSKAAEQIFGTNFKAKRYLGQMTQRYYTEIVYDNGLELDFPENQKLNMNFHITSDKYTMLLANGQSIKVGMNADELKAVFPKSYSKRKVITNTYGKIGKVSFKVDFSITRNNIVYHEDAWIEFILSGEHGILEEFYSYESQ